MPLTLRVNYWDDPSAKREFIRFIRTIHNVDFTLWDDAGYWDAQYVPYSFFDSDRVVSSVCIYTMPAILEGAGCRIAQVSGVGTLPDYRRRGLNRQLTETALAEILPRHRLLFLFSDTDAVGFYQKCGFRAVEDYAAVFALEEIAPRPGLMKVDPVADVAARRALFHTAQHREPISNRLANQNPELVMYHAFYGLRGCVHFIPQLESFALLKRTADRVILYDVIARKFPRLETLAPFLITADSALLECRFPTDKFTDRTPQLLPLSDNNTHVWHEHHPAEPLIFPHTCHA